MKILDDFSLSVCLLKDLFAQTHLDVESSGRERKKKKKKKKKKKN